MNNGDGQRPLSPVSSTSQTTGETQGSAMTTVAEDVPTASFPDTEYEIDDMPALQSVSDSDSDIDPADFEADSDDDMPGLEPTTFLTEAGTATGATPASRRRARVENDEDDERDRRHPSQRVGTSIDQQYDNPALVTPLPPMPADSQLHMPQTGPPEQQPRNPPVGMPRLRATLGFPAFFRTAIISGPGFARQQQANGQRGAGAQPNPLGFQGPVLGGFAMSFTLDANGQPVPTGPTQFGGAPPQTNQGAGAAGPGPTANVNPNVRPLDASALRRFFGFVQNAMADGLWDREREQEDPERAQRLVDALEAVPVGLVRRLERVGNVGGGSGDNEKDGAEDTGATGGDVGCAICWDRLLDGDGGWEVKNTSENRETPATENTTTTEATNEASSSTAPAAEVESTEKPADKAPEHPKIVSLPCAHVFHASCLIPWFSRPHQTTCPTCRFNIDPENLTYVRRNSTPQEGQGAPNAAPTAPGAAAPTANGVVDANPATTADENMVDGAEGDGIQTEVLIFGDNDPPHTLLLPGRINAPHTHANTTHDTAANAATPGPTMEDELPPMQGGIIDPAVLPALFRGTPLPNLPPDQDPAVLMGVNPVTAAALRARGIDPADADQLRTRISEARRGVQTLEGLRDALMSRLGEVEVLEGFARAAEAGGWGGEGSGQTGPEVQQTTGRAGAQAQGGEGASTAPASDNGGDDDDPPLMPLPNEAGDVVMDEAGQPNASTNAPSPAGPPLGNDNRPNPRNAIGGFFTVGFDILIGTGPARNFNLAGGDFDGEGFTFGGAPAPAPGPPPTESQPHPTPVSPPSDTNLNGNAGASTQPPAAGATVGAEPTTTAERLQSTVDRATGWLRETQQTVDEAMEVLFGTGAQPLQFPANAQPELAEAQRTAQEAQGRFQEARERFQNLQQGGPQLPDLFTTIFGGGGGGGGTNANTNTNAGPTPGGQAQPVVPPAPAPNANVNPAPNADANPTGNTNPPPRPTNNNFQDFLNNIIRASGAAAAAAVGGGLGGFEVPPPLRTRPSAQPRAPRTWTLPPPPGPTLRQRVERKEREAGLRCHDFSCGVGPSDEEPFLGVSDKAKKQVSIVIRKRKHVEAGEDVDMDEDEGMGNVCSHTFHVPCLVSAARLNMMGAETAVVGEYVEVACSVCRGVGAVTKGDWDEGVSALA